MTSQIKKIALAVLTLTVVIGCVEFKKVALYDGVEQVKPEPLPENISLIVEPTIYDDAVNDAWGLEENACQKAEVSQVAYSGDQSISIEWNRGAEGCEWSGIGIGWDGYAGKDLSPLMDKAAIQMYVRTKKGRAFGLPFVLTLEDYSGGMGFCYTSNKYFERSAIDEEWQKVIVPLKDFDTEIENLDPTNIKQLQIELQQSGSVYLDDIQLIIYEAPKIEPWLVEDKRPDPTAAPIQFFDDAFINDNGWGLVNGKCHTVELTEKEQSEGTTSIHVKWNKTDACKFMAWGLSWNKWFPVDVTPIQGIAAIQFDLKLASGKANEIPLKIGFEDYERAKRFTTLKSDFVQGGMYTDSWKQVTVPLSSIPGNGMDFKRIKQLYMDMEGSGEVYIDNMRLVKL